MVRSRLLDLTFVFIAIAAAVFSTTRYLATRATTRHDSGTISLGTLRVGQYLSHHVQVPLPAAVASSALQKVVATCGCTALETWQLDAGGHDLDVNLTTEPGPYMTSMESILQLYFEGTEILEIPIHVAIEPPFPGWPSAAGGCFKENRFIISLESGYTQIPLVVHCYAGDETSLRCDRTPDGNIAIFGIDPSLLDTYELTVSFPGGTSTHVWSGPLDSLAMSAPNTDKGAHE